MRYKKKRGKYRVVQIQLTPVPRVPSYPVEAVQTARVKHHEVWGSLFRSDPSQCRYLLR